MNAPHKHEHGQHHHPAAKRPIHKNWMLWVGVVLMLVAMLAYVLSVDESIEPGVDTVDERVPAAAGP